MEDELFCLPIRASLCVFPAKTERWIEAGLTGQIEVACGMHRATMIAAGSMAYRPKGFKE
jgi:hypothetical protein